MEITINQPVEMHAKASRLAIVIPTFNSARTLGACLESIRSQDTRPDEVLIVDDVRTTDPTRSIARAHLATVIVSPAGMSESRNIGVRAASSPILLSLDSDMVLEPGLLAAIALRFGNKDVDGATVLERGVGQGYWARARAIDKESVEATGYGRSLRVFRRELFHAIGGYDEALEAGEDADFHARAVAAGARLCHMSQPAILHDEGRLRLSAVASKKFHYGTTMPAFEAKHRWTMLSAGYGRRIAVGAVISVRRDPLVLPGFLILKATDLIAGLAGRHSATRVGQA